MSSASAQGRRIGFTEFLVLTAAMMACQAFAVDGMLPALPTIAHALGLSSANRAQLIVTAYVAGAGCGQLVWGMLSDRYGRRPILSIGLAAYVIAALLCSSTRSFDALLGWRFLHGTAAASLVTTRSVIRDLYAGRQMARVMSLTFIVFLMVPVVAPSLGQLLLLLGSWRLLFVMFGGFAAVVWVWLLLRLPETLHPEYRLRLDRARLTHALRLVLFDRAALCYTFAIACVFGSLLAYVGMVQQIFADVFHRAQLMPTVFGICAASMGVASYLNSRFVERLGMRVISHGGLLLLLAVSGVHVLVAALGLERLSTFIVLQSLTLACFGLTATNFGAMAMEPMGAVAGLAASLQGFVTMFGAAMIGGLIGREFNGTTLPLALGHLAGAIGALLFVLWAEQGRLFRAHHASAGGAYGAAASEV
jgi:MFS transporter, DHA1 family, multidrug resistance protein